jgi:hypothetical protein
VTVGCLRETQNFDPKQQASREKKEKQLYWSISQASPGRNACSKLSTLKIPCLPVRRQNKNY